MMKPAHQLLLNAAINDFRLHSAAKQFKHLNQFTGRLAVAFPMAAV